MSKVDEVDSSLSERPGHHRPRRLADWLNPTGARKVHSLIDKVYKRKNLQIAWERVEANQGAGGVDGESIEAFAERLRVSRFLCDRSILPEGGMSCRSRTRL